MMTSPFKRKPSNILSRELGKKREVFAADMFVNGYPIATIAQVLNLRRTAVGRYLVNQGVWPNHKLGFAHHPLTFVPLFLAMGYKTADYDSRRGFVVSGHDPRTKAPPKPLGVMPKEFHCKSPEHKEQTSHAGLGNNVPVVHGNGHAQPTALRPIHRKPSARKGWHEMERPIPREVVEPKVARQLQNLMDTIEGLTKTVKKLQDKNVPKKSFLSRLFGL